MAEKLNVDFEWVKKREGATLTNPYVPVCTAKSIKNSKNLSCFGKPLGSVIGKSGVTVASGFDIGQHNEYDLSTRYRLPDHIVTKLKPFLGLKGEDAKKALRENSNVVLQRKDVEHIDATLKNHFLKFLSTKYKKDTGKEFSSLSSSMQTSIFSVVYNYGENSIKAKGVLSDFWGKVILGDFAGAAKGLEKMNDNNGRRKLEAELLSNHIEK